MKKILVIAAHPDDEVLGCGGTIARMSQEGNEVSIVILGEGITSRYPDRKSADTKLIQNLHAHSRKAVKILGANNLQIFDLPDNRFDTVALLDIVKILEGVIEKQQPECIFTHHPSDLNIDHTITNRAVLIATRPLGDSPVKTILTFEIPSSTEWAFNTTGVGFLPNLFIDVTKTIDLKIEAMKQYDGESRVAPHPRSAKSLRANASRWGSVSGIHAAEAFQLIRHIQ